MLTVRTSWGVVATCLAIVNISGLARGSQPTATARTSEPFTLVADSDPDLTNMFTVTFPPELGGETQTADIPLTQFVLEVDLDSGSARLLSWFQQVDPFDLLGFSTGNITIVLGGPSAGTYQEPSGEFVTAETYQILFDDTGLAQFGFVSPFVVPAAASGTLAFETETEGIISMEWAGESEVPNPDDPDQPFVFTYSCTINASFSTQPTVVVALGDPNAENSFTVEFPGELGGGTQTADIPHTEMVLELLPDLSSARLLNWFQQVDPFDLLGISTGDITITLGGPSIGSFDDMTGEFATEESYQIFFDDSELVELGFDSPYLIPASSAGVITFVDSTNGTVAMEWEGVGELENPDDPSNPFLFTYSCVVNALFGDASACQGDANGDGAVDPLDSGFVSARFGCPVGTGDAECDLADQNVDGAVDPLDVGFVLARFGTCG